MDNRYINALVKTGITAAGLHVVFLIAGFLFGKQIGWLNLPMIWAHWHDALGISVSLILSVVLYFVIFAFCTSDADA